MSRLLPAALGLTLLAAAGAHAQPGPGQGPGGRDADGDGMVMAAEFEASALQRFSRMDANQDGVIDAAEIAAWRQRVEARGGRGGGRMLAMLNEQDADKDGRITRDEALAASRARFAEADKDGDGKLSGDEIRRGRPAR